MIGMRTGRQDFTHLRVKGHQADHILLLLEHVGQTRGTGAGVVELRAVLAVLHRLAGVHDQGALEVGFLFVFFDVEAVRFGPDLPVEMPRVVAGRVFAMRRELDGEAVVGRTVLARDKPFDDQAGTQIEPLDAIEGFGVEIVLAGGGGPLGLSLTSSSFSFSYSCSYSPSYS